MTEEKADHVICEVCGCELEREDSIEEDGKVLCEDCYIESHHKIKTCDFGHFYLYINNLRQLYILLI